MSLQQARRPMGVTSVMAAQAQTQTQTQLQMQTQTQAKDSSLRVGPKRAPNCSLPWRRSYTTASRCSSSHLSHSNRQTLSLRKHTSRLTSFRLGSSPTASSLSLVAALSISTCAYFSAPSRSKLFNVTPTSRYTETRPTITQSQSTVSHCQSQPQSQISYITIRSASSFPHLNSLRQKLQSLPNLISASSPKMRAHTGNSHDDGHNHNQGHDHSHSHSHSHSPFSHHHHHDNAYLTSQNKADPGVRITRIGLISNLGMAVAKFAGGWAFNSKAMTADAWHSITDLASDVLTLATVTWSLKPPTDRFPMGFGKVESLGSLGVSGMLLAGGLYMGWDSGISLYGHFYPDSAHGILEHVGHGHGHSHSHGAAALGIPSMHAAWLAAGTILIKEWLYHATMKVARERKSSVLASNAIHHRVDSLTGFVTLAAIIGANVVENAAWLDPVGGLLISFMVIHAGLGNTMAAFRELVDQGIDDEIKTSVSKHARKALSKLGDGHEVELREVSGIKSGQNYLVDLEMAVPGIWSVDMSKEVEDAVRTQVGGKVRGVRRVRIRFAPKEAPVNAKFDDFIPGTVTHVLEESESDEPNSNGSGGLGHRHENGHKNSDGHSHRD